MKNFPRCIALALMVVFIAVGSANAVFINEIHYDNSGGDEGEAIEVAGAAGTDLDSWSIVLYNGGNGTEYGSIALTGIIPDQQNGYGVLSFDATGLQNGPDGLALYNGTAVSQFLSYEGSFTAVGGIADGLASLDIGLSEATSTDIGFSLQLAGNGVEYTDFTWSGPTLNSFDAINTGQTFEPSSVPIPGAVWLLGTGLIALVGVRRNRT